MDAQALSERDLDLIYDAAVRPDLWRDVIRRLMALTHAETAALMRLDLEEGGGQILTADDKPELRSAFLDYYCKINPLHLVDDASDYARGWTAKVLVDEDWIPRDELERSEYYNDFLLQCDGAWSLIVRLSLEGRRLATVSLGRSLRRGRFEEAEIAQARRMQPHMIRAFALTERMTALGGLSEDLATALERAGSPMILLTGEGRILHLNGLAERLVSRSDVLRAAAGRLSAVEPSGGERLARTVARAGARDWRQRTSGAVQLERPGGGPPLTLTVAPLRAEDASVFASGVAVLICVNDAADPDSAKTAARFDLSRAEQRLTAALIGGLSLRQAAESFGVSINTARTQLAHVFQKTGTHTQAELMRLLMSLR